MAEIDDAIYTYLLTKVGLTTLISQRIFPNELPQGTTLPAVVYIDVSDVKNHTLTAQSKLEEPMKQYTVYAASKLAARSVASQIKLALCDYSGTLSGIVIQYIRLENELASLETSADGTIKTYYHDLEFQITYVKE